MTLLLSTQKYTSPSARASVDVVYFCGKDIQRDAGMGEKTQEVESISGQVMEE